MEAETRPAETPRPTWLFLLVLVAATLAAYHNCYTAPYYLDDVSAIAENRKLNKFWPATSLGSRRLVGHWSFALNYWLDGTDVWGYRAVNVGIHILAGLFLFGLVRRTLELPKVDRRYGAQAKPLAFAAALLWLVHPLQTNGVTYVVQRLESLMGLFFLICLYCIARGSQAKRPWGWYLGSVAACWLGMATKEVMIAAPLVALLYDRIFLAASWGEVLRRRGWVYLAFATAVIWLLGRTTKVLTPLFEHQVATANETALGRRDPTVGFDIKDLTAWEYLRSQGGVILHYLRLSFWPDRLCLDYMWPVAQEAWDIYIPSAVVAALLLASLAALARWPKIGFLGVAFFLILAPTSSVMPIRDLAFEHRMYLPLAAVVVLVVVGLHAVLTATITDSKARRLVMLSMVTLAAGGLLLRTIDRNADYHDPLVIWSQSLAQAPHHWRAHQNMGIALERQDKKDLAREHYKKAIQLRPDNHRLYYNLGRLEAQRGNVDQAAQLFRQAIELNPRNARAHNDLALILADQREFDVAISHLRKAAQADPQAAIPHVNLGDVFVQQGDFHAAADHFRRAVELNPDYLVTRVKLATCLYRIGQAHSATEVLREALKRNAGLYEGVLLMGWILATHENPQVRNGAEAIRLLEPIRKLTANTDPLTLDVLSAAYAETGELEKAVQTATLAMRLAKSRDDDLGEKVQLRVERYAAGEPWRESSEYRPDLGFLEAAESREDAPLGGQR